MNEHTAKHRFDRREFLSSLIAGSALGMLPFHNTRGISDVSAGTVAGDYTNIIFILSDDQGQWANGCYGNAEIRTPHIDRLAAGGAKFNHAYVSTPVCSPSRATFLTGEIPSQHGIHDYLTPSYTLGDRAQVFLKDELTVSDILKSHGYTCGVFGKWHLGREELPQKGFDEWHIQLKATNMDPTISINGDIRSFKGFNMEIHTDAAIRFIEQNKNNPFFLYLPYHAPHTPYTKVPERYTNLYKKSAFSMNRLPGGKFHPWIRHDIVQRGYFDNDDSIRAYYALITAMDEQIGRIVQKVEQSGLQEKTLIIFTSDHGLHFGQRGLWGKGNATHPRNMFEESVLIPLVAYQPGIIEPGQVFNQLVSSYDFFPTFLESAGIPVPAHGNLPGNSFHPLLTGRTYHEHDAVYGEYGDTRMIRTKNWKYIYRSGKYPNALYLYHELYDLQNDPGETRNLIDDPAYDVRRRVLHNALQEWFNRYNEGKVFHTF